MPSEESTASIETLRQRVRSMNFVYAVGYSLEKVHSGVLFTLLRSPEHGPRLVSSLWNELSDSVRVSSRDIPSDKICVGREKKIAKGCVPDMVLTFRNSRTDEVHHIVFEYKVDGTSGYERQCRHTRESFLKNHPDDEPRTLFVFATMGGCRFWKRPEGFLRLDIGDLLEILDEWRDEELVRQYLVALGDEVQRGKLASIALDLWKDDENKRELGYRGYDWWYAYYDALRNGFSSPKEWEIYTGGHNPVLNWAPAFGSELNGANECPFGTIYCEFNWDKFIIKLAWHDGNKDAEGFNNVVDEILKQQWAAEFCRSRRTWNPKKYSSIASFSPDPDPPPNIQTIATWTNDLIPGGFLSICDAIKSACNPV